MSSDKYIKTSMRTDKQGITFIDVIKKDTFELIASIPFNFDDELIVHSDYTVLGSYGDLAYKSENNKEYPEPVQRALKRIRELEYITDVRIDEEFEVCDKHFDYPNNRLTITIDYLDVELFKKLKEEAKLKYEYSEDH